MQKDQTIESIHRSLIKKFGYFPFSTNDEIEIRNGFDEVLLPFKKSGKIKAGILTIDVGKYSTSGKLKLVFPDDVIV